MKSKSPPKANLLFGLSKSNRHMPEHSDSRKSLDKRDLVRMEKEFERT